MFFLIDFTLISRYETLMNLNVKIFDVRIRFISMVMMKALIRLQIKYDRIMKAKVKQACAKKIIRTNNTIPDSAIKRVNLFNFHFYAFI